MFILDVFYNKLIKFLDFILFKNLKEVNFGYNEIEEMADLFVYYYFIVFNLDRIFYLLNIFYKIIMSYMISYF